MELELRTKELEKKNGKELKRIEEVERKNERLQEKVKELEIALQSWEKGLVKPLWPNLMHYEFDFGKQKYFVDL